MGNRNDNDYLDMDNFDDSYDSRDYRRRQPNRRQGNYNRRPPHNRHHSTNRRRRNKRRTRNRIIIVLSGIVIVVLFVMLLTFMFKGCQSGSPDPNSVSTDTITKQEASAATTVPQATEAPKDDLSPTNFKTFEIKDDNSNGEFYNNVYVWNNAGYELFYDNDTNAKSYADAINGFAEKLSGITVYDMVIPNHSEYSLPQRLKDSNNASSQANNIKNIYSKLSDKVTPINAYNYLADHNTDYIYFNSDNCWTGLGAYYAYKAFADTNDLTPLSLDDCTENKVEGFTGSYTNDSGTVATDTVQYWDLPYTITTDVTSGDGSVATYNTPYYSGATAGSYTYGLFLMGDYNPLTVLKSNSDSAGNGKKIAVIKESYGNAFASYLTNNYEEVHVIDFRTFRNVQTDLVNYCKQNSINEVLFLNNIMSTTNQLDSMNSLFD